MLSAKKTLLITLLSSAAILGQANEEISRKNSLKLSRLRNSFNGMRKTAIEEPQGLFVTESIQSDGRAKVSISNDGIIPSENSFPPGVLSLSLSYSNLKSDVQVAFFDSYSARSSWPECVSKPLTCEECQNHIIEEKNPEISIISIVPEGSFVTYDYRTDRVRIFCNGTNVTSIPVIM